MQEHLENLFDHQTEEGFNTYLDRQVIPAIVEKDQKFTVTYKFAVEQLSSGNKKFVFVLGESLYKYKKSNRTILFNAQLHFELEDYSEALLWLNRLNPSRITFNSLEMKLNCLVRLERYAEAIDVGNWMLKLKRKGTEVEYLLGQSYFELEIYEEAFDSYLKVWKNNLAVWPEILYKFAPLKMWDLKEIAENVKDHTELNQMELYSLASYYYYRQEYERCHQFLMRILKNDPDHLESLVMQVKVLSSLRLNQCIKFTFYKLIEVGKSTSWFLEVVDILFNENILYNDIKPLVNNLYYEEIQTPQVIEALGWLVKFALKDGQEKDVYNYINNILDHTIERDYLSHLFAPLYERLDKSKEKIMDTYQKGLELGVNDKEILYNLVSYCIQNQEFEEAIKFMEKYELTIYWNPKLQKIKDRILLRAKS